MPHLLRRTPMAACRGRVCSWKAGWYLRKELERSYGGLWGRNQHAWIFPSQYRHVLSPVPLRRSTAQNQLNPFQLPLRLHLFLTSDFVDNLPWSWSHTCQCEGLLLPLLLLDLQFPGDQSHATGPYLFFVSQSPLILAMKPHWEVLLFAMSRFPASPYLFGFFVLFLVFCLALVLVLVLMFSSSTISLWLIPLLLGLTPWLRGYTVSPAGFVSTL